MINAKQLEEIQKHEHIVRCIETEKPCFVTVKQLADTLSAALKVVEAAKECVGELGLNSSMEELEKALAPFTEEKEKK